MKQFTLFTMLLFTPLAVCANAHDDLVTTIIESDYENFTNIYKHNIFSEQEAASYIDLANKMIAVRHDWMVKHHHAPMLGWDLIMSAVWGATAYVGLGCFALTGMAAEAGRNEIAIFTATLGLGIATSSGYFSIKRLIAAYQKPKKLLAGAIRIKDALASSF